MYSALDIAARVINKYSIEGEPITNLKLQKILYYVQGYTLRQQNQSAFSEGIYKWPYGPVVPQVYFHYNSNRGKPLPEPSDEHTIRLSREFKKNSAIADVIDSVIERSFLYTPTELVEMTHEEKPWKEAKDSELIPTEKISAYFHSNNPLGIEEH